MQSDYPEVFERDTASTLQEWRARLLRAIGPHPWEEVGPFSARVHFAHGTLELKCKPLPDRVLAQLRLPRLRVRFQFCGLSSDERHVFMRHFDLVMQRGGG